MQLVERRRIMRISYASLVALFVFPVAVADAQGQKDKNIQRITFSDSAKNDSIDAGKKKYPNPF